jgi:error-prone DNA polymerase
VYAELVCRSNFSFLKGASHPEELVALAHRFGLSALALTDDDGLYGAPKAHLAAKAAGLRTILGSRLTLTDGPPLVVYAQDLAGYENLCRLLSHSRLTHAKGEAGLSWREVANRSQGLWAVLPFPDEVARVAPLAEAFPGRFYVGACRTLSADDEPRLARALSLSRALEVPICAHNDVHAHVRRRQPLQDVLTAIHHGVPVGQCGRRLFPNAERVLKSPAEMAQLFADLPEAVGRTLEIADACRFSLDEIAYQFPEEDLPEGHTRASWLAHLVEEGLRFRYPAGIPERVRVQVKKELELIERLRFEGYFLTLHDIVRFARSRGILCQGRGSAANSAVCYALQITAIDPVRMGLLFERFLSEHRSEPPDIDVDFEHERREEVLQYVYAKHGRHRAGMVCEVICYRGRLAIREVGKALGLSLDQVDRLAKSTEALGTQGLSEQILREVGLSPKDRAVQQTLALAMELEGFPRHLSIHVGGFVITKGPLIDLIPVENAAMKDRTVVQWEKDDLNALKILKVDLLGLGMLTVIAKCLELVARHHGRALSLATIPAEDASVYDMLCEADAIGCFQVESRAQMNMLPRLRPRTFYDLVIQIALIRPGPIIGEMVHPYLRRRDGLEPVDYPTEEVRAILEKTLGVPLFQEQAMKLAMVAAGFSPAEADELRRILSHKRAEELLLPFRQRFIDGCLARGYSREFAERCFLQFRGFAHYGFPESHSASFALIAYASAYLKRYYPDAFCAAIINSQPMGFYAVHTLVDDAKRHGTEVRPIDVNRSSWDCLLEEGAAVHLERSEAKSKGQNAPEISSGPVNLCPVRLGLRLVKGLSQASADRLVSARTRPYTSVGDLARRSGLPRHDLVRLAAAGALANLCGDRREALWEIQALGPLDDEDLFFGIPMDTHSIELPSFSPGEKVSADFATTGVSLDRHPMELFRPLLHAHGAITAEGLTRVRAGKRVGIGGLVICRQRPPTAKGFTFLSLEDETGIANLIVPPQLFDKYRRALLGSALLFAEGVLERAGKVVNVKVDHASTLTLGRRRAPAGEGVAASPG